MWFRYSDLPLRDPSARLDQSERSFLPPQPLVTRECQILAGISLIRTCRCLCVCDCKRLWRNLLGRTRVLQPSVRWSSKSGVGRCRAGRVDVPPDGSRQPQTVPGLASPQRRSGLEPLHEARSSVSTSASAAGVSCLVTTEAGGRPGAAEKQVHKCQAFCIRPERRCGGAARGARRRTCALQFCPHHSHGSSFQCNLIEQISYHSPKRAAAEGFTRDDCG